MSPLERLKKRDPKDAAAKYHHWVQETDFRRDPTAPSQISHNDDTGGKQVWCLCLYVINKHVSNIYIYIYIYIYNLVKLFRLMRLMTSWQTVVMSATAIALVVTATIRMLKPSSRNVHFLFLCQSPMFGIRRKMTKERFRKHNENFHPFQGRKRGTTILLTQKLQKSWREIGTWDH